MGVRLEQLTWIEAERALLRMGTVVLPVGAGTDLLRLELEWRPVDGPGVASSGGGR